MERRGRLAWRVVHAPRHEKGSINIGKTLSSSTAVSDQERASLQAHRRTCEIADVSRVAAALSYLLRKGDITDQQYFDLYDDPNVADVEILDRAWAVYFASCG
jgi:hypothetical protein